MNDNNFVMFGNYKEYFEMLNADQCKQLILMLFEYSETGIINQCDDIQVNLVYKTLTDNIIIGTKRRIASIENGKKGGRPRKNGSKPRQTQANPTAKQLEQAEQVTVTPEVKEEPAAKQSSVSAKEAFAVGEFNRKFKTNYKMISSEFAIVADRYSEQEILKAIDNAYRDDFWTEKATPMNMFKPNNLEKIINQEPKVTTANKRLEEQLESVEW